MVDVLEREHAARSYHDDDKSDGPVRRSRARLIEPHPHERRCLLDRERALGPMNDRMAVGTDGPQIFDRVQLILAIDLGERLQMVNMDESCPDFTILNDEIKTTDGAARPIMGDAFVSCPRTRSQVGTL
jgi:hypothetical protein